MGRAVLVLDDDDLVTRMLAVVLAASGYKARLVSSVAAAMQALDADEYDALLLDMVLPDGSGLEVLSRALERAPAPQVLMMTGKAEIRGAVEAMRSGAVDYIEKPFEVADLTMRLERALESATHRRKLALYEEMDRQASKAVLASRTLKEVFAVATRLAATPSSSALILGESGVGKEVLAAHIHAASERRRAPFVKVNLAAIPESMIESELFGSVRGAFTDSKRDRAGHFASAEGGTLLLDELCEFKPELQPKLLRVLEERRYFPVGSDRERELNVRVLAATNRSPEAAMASGQLRADLYYRLSTVVLRIPPLRERREDILPLAEHYLRKFSAEFGRSKSTFTAATRDVLLAYDWPGNARELRNVIERAAMLADSDAIGPDSLDLPSPPPESSRSRVAGAGDEPSSLLESERMHIERVLGLAGGSRTRAAAMLGISRTTLWDKLKRYGLA